MFVIMSDFVSVVVVMEYEGFFSPLRYEHKIRLDFPITSNVNAVSSL